MSAHTAVIVIEIAAHTGITFPSSPMRSIVAAAFCSLAGDITLASPPPMPLAAATSSPSAPIFSEVVRWSLVRIASDDAS